MRVTSTIVVCQKSKSPTLLKQKKNQWTIFTWVKAEEAWIGIEQKKEEEIFAGIT